MDTQRLSNLTLALSLTLSVALSGCGAPLLGGAASGPLVPSDRAWNDQAPPPTHAPASLARASSAADPYLLPGEAPEERAPSALATAGHRAEPLMPSDAGWQPAPAAAPSATPERARRRHRGPLIAAQQLLPNGRRTNATHRVG